MKDFDRQFELGVMNNNSTNVSVNPNSSSANDSDKNMTYTQDNDENVYNPSEKIIPGLN